MRPPLVALVAFGAACGEHPAPGEERLEASRHIGFGDIANLGPHRMEASITRVELRDGARLREQSDQTRLRWKDWDDFELARHRDGELRVRYVVRGGRGQALRADGTLQAVADVEPFRVEVRQDWDVWTPFLGALQDQIAYVFQGQALLEGRLANQYAVSVAPPGVASPVTRTVPDHVEGTLWIDEATGVRLMADVSTRWYRRGRDEWIHEDRLILVRTDFGLVTEPPGS